MNLTDASRPYANAHKKGHRNSCVRDEQVSRGLRSSFIDCVARWVPGVRCRTIRHTTTAVGTQVFSSRRQPFSSMWSIILTLTADRTTLALERTKSHQNPLNTSVLGASQKLRKVTMSFVMSVRRSVCLSTHWTNFHGELYFSKICRENSSFIKIPQE